MWHRWTYGSSEVAVDQGNEGLMFIGEPTNITTMWTLYSSVNEHKLGIIYIYCLFWLPPRLGSLQNRHNYIILIPATTSSTYKEMYETNAILHNSVRFKHHCETMKWSSDITPLGRYPPLLPACVEHRLGKLVSHRGVTLWVWSLWDIDMSVLDHHKNREKQYNSMFDIIWPRKPIFN
jgi:hypothetical protein